MILLTGGTGFVGRALIPRLAEGGHAVRVLLRPSRRTPRLPQSIPVQVAIASLTDGRGLRTAFVGVDTLIHLAGAGWQSQPRDIMSVDVEGTRMLLEAARAAGVSRVLFLSHLGADRASAYPVLKAKGIAEEFVRQSGLAHTILRSAVVFGPEDAFMNVVAAMLQLGPFFLMPGDGRITLQPLWIDDLATCLEWSLSESGASNQTLSLGGPEFLTFRQMVDMVMEVLRLRRPIWNVRPAFLRGGAWFLEGLLPRSPLSTRWLDYLAISRTCELTSVSRYFGLKPVRFGARTLEYMLDKHWAREMARLILGR